MSTLEDLLRLINSQAAQLLQVAQKAKELLAENEQLKQRIAELEKSHGPV